MKCPSCGAEIGGAKICDYCGSQITGEMQREQERLNKKGCPKCGSGNISFRRENQGEVNGKKSKQVIHRTVGVCSDCGATWFADSEVKKRKTWLWVLGWLFIFPLPLTILLLRKKDMNQYLKYAVIAIAWIVYLLIAVSGGKNSETTKPADDTGDGMVVTWFADEEPEEEPDDPEEPEEPKETAATTVKTEATTKAAKKPTGIRPEFKKAMDDYEAFFDEYIDFMETYSKSDNPVALMAKYAEYMARYSEMMQSMDELGDEDMSDAETAYYLEVTTRINTKLAKSAAA